MSSTGRVGTKWLTIVALIKFISLGQGPVPWVAASWATILVTILDFQLRRSEIPSEVFCGGRASRDGQTHQVIGVCYRGPTTRNTVRIGFRVITLGYRFVPVHTEH
jgi:hypothetical protein